MWLSFEVTTNAMQERGVFLLVLQPAIRLLFVFLLQNPFSTVQRFDDTSGSHRISAQYWREQTCCSCCGKEGHPAAEHRAHWAVSSLSVNGSRLCELEDSAARSKPVPLRQQMNRLILGDSVKIAGTTCGHASEITKSAGYTGS